jgi:hypothetical protein
MRCLFSLGIPYLYGELFFAFLEQQEDLLSINEYNYIKSTISKKSVPTVQALFKDHKKEKDVKTSGASKEPHSWLPACRTARIEEHT